MSESDIDKRAAIRQGRSFLWPALLLSVFVAVAVLYAAVVPPFEGPDSGAHFGYIAYLSKRRTLPVADSATAAISHELVLQPPLYYAVVALLTPPSAIDSGLRLNTINPYYALGLSKRATYNSPDEPITTLALWIARLVSLLGGVLAVLGAWLLARELLPESPWAWLAAASIVGFTPQFLFVSSSITNDAWPTGLGVMALWLAARSSSAGDFRRWGWLAAGGLLGLAALSKYSGLVVAVPFAGLLVMYWRRFGWQGAVRAGVWSVFGAALTAGFWFARNYLLYRSPVPLNSLLSLLPGLARGEAASPTEIWSQMPVFERSYWGIYGYGILAQPWFYRATGFLSLLGLLGVTVLLVWRRRGAAAGSVSTAVLSLVWLAAGLASAVSYMRTVYYADQGRLLFSAAPAIALLLVLGWQALVPRSLRTPLCQLIPLLFLFLALSQVTILREGYRMPAGLADVSKLDRLVNARFAGGMGLVGIDFPLGAGGRSGDLIPITLYLRADHPIDDFYTLFLHLTDSKGDMLWQFDGVPWSGRHPTRQWAPGEVFTDTYVVTVPTIAEDGLATLSAGFYQYQTPDKRQSLLGVEPPQDRVVLSKVRLHAGAQNGTAPAEAPLAAWSNGIQLQSATFERDGDGAPRTAVLRWQAQNAVQVDYTVSIQFLDAAGGLVAQVDKQPLDGAYPTSTWRAGDVIVDEYSFPEPLPPWHSMIVLLYDSSGKRLSLETTRATASDYYLLQAQ